MSLLPTERHSVFTGAIWKGAGGLPIVGRWGSLIPKIAGVRRRENCQTILPDRPRPEIYSEMASPRV